MSQSTKASIGLFALTMLMTGAVDGISNVPSIAIFGPQLIFFFVMGGLFFLLPAGLVSAELCAQFSQGSGIYYWSKKAYGSHFATIAIWLQWVNTLVWFPTCLTTLAGTGAYLIEPKLAHDPIYLVGMSLTIFWTMTIINLKGIKRSAKIASLATSIGLLLPMISIISLSLLWLLLKKPLAVQLTSATMFPSLTKMYSWVSLTAVVTSFLGMELAAVHVRKVENAQVIFPKALFLAIIMIMFTMGLASLGVTLVIPHEHIVLVAGTIQAFKTFFMAFHIPWADKIMGVLLIIGSLGAMVNWLISPANGLAQAAHDQYLPVALAQENIHGVPSKILLLQGVVVSIVSTAFFLMPSVNGSYWLLLDLSTELYLIMYLLMFIAGLKLIINLKTIKVIPGGKIVAILICCFGLIGTSIVLLVGFFSPGKMINVGGANYYAMVFTGGILLMLSPVLLLYWHRWRVVQLKNKAVI